MDPAHLATPRHAVAVIGGACSGAEAAELLAKAGVVTVVFEQNARPFGKIEDGLPRWHARQRSQEYVRIGEKLKTPGIVYVPSTTIGEHVTFENLRDWGFSAIVLACGAWGDRPLGVDGEQAAEGKGLVFQNPFIYWFNHHEESTYDGPRYEIADGAVIVGGGLASIDVVKATMLETTAAKLRERGIHADVVEMEHQGLNKVLDAHGLTLADLGLRGCTLVYRRSAREMPVAQFKDGADEASKQKTMDVREKLMALTQQKFLCQFRPNTLPKRLVFDDAGNVCGLEVVTTRTEGRKVIEVEGTTEVIPTTQVFSSIGSIPRPIPGLPLRGEFYDYEDWDLGRVKGMPEVFGVGNVVTGQGNIAISRRHAQRVTDVLIQKYLGLHEERLDEPGGVLHGAEAAGAEAAGKVLEHLDGKSKLDPAALQALVARARARGAEVGYDGGFDAWIAKHTPPDRV